MPEWTKLSAELPDSADTAIELLTTTYNGVEYGAGRCFVRFLGGNIPAWAVTAGKERKITSQGDALGWLIEHGLAGDVAQGLMKDADESGSVI